MEIEAKIDYSKLKKLADAMNKQLTVKIGLLATKAGENGKKGNDPVSENIDLAGLGAVHEFGCTIDVTDKMRNFLRYKFGINLKKGTTQVKIPTRSFLQMPLEKKDAILNKLKNNFKNIDELVDYVSQTGDLVTLGVMIGAAALEQVQEAFDTEGFGKWKPDSSFTIAQKGSKSPLIDTGTLRRAITYEVKENE